MSELGRPDGTIHSGLRGRSMFKKTLIDSLHVAEICGESWDDMRGTEQIRFCSHCEKNVNNISAMTRKEATRLVRESGRNLCIRYVSDRERGTPVFARPLFQIGPRSSRIAAGALTAAIGFASGATAQSTTEDQPSEVVETIRHGEEAKGTPESSSVSGFVLDLQGRGVSGVTVWLKSSDSYSYSEYAETDENGNYSFAEVEAGTYVLRIYSSAGTWKKAMPAFEIADGQQIFENLRVVAHYEKGEEGAGTGEGVGSGYGGAVAMTPYKVPLNHAIFREDVQLVRQLIEENADVNAKDENYDDISPIFVAAEVGNIEIVKILLDAGARVSAVDKTNRTPLMFIDDDATPELIRILIAAGANPNASDDEGYSPLLRVWSSVDEESLKALITAGADVNAKTKIGETALMLAAEEGSVSAVETLILAGADVRDRSDDGQSAWDRTTEPKIEALLESYGAESDFGPVKVTVIQVRDEN